MSLTKSIMPLSSIVFSCSILLTFLAKEQPRLNYGVCSLNPPAPLLQAHGLEISKNIA